MRQLRRHKPNPFPPSFPKDLVENRFLTLVQVHASHRILNARVWETQDITEFSSLNWLNLWTNLVQKQNLLSCSRCLFEEAEIPKFQICGLLEQYKHHCVTLRNLLALLIENWLLLKWLYLKAPNQFWESTMILRTFREMKRHIEIS